MALSAVFCGSCRQRLLPLFASHKQRRFSRAVSSGRQQLVILGTGWAGYSVLRSVDKALFDVIVVSPRNHFLFTPLLASTTVGTLEFRSIIEPVRNAGFRDEHHFHLSNAVGLDPSRRLVTCRSMLDGHEYEISYDKLVIAVGGRANTFGVPGVEKHAFFLKVRNCTLWALNVDEQKKEKDKKVEGDIILP